MPGYHKHPRPSPRRKKPNVYARKKWRGIRARYLAANPVCAGYGGPCDRLATEVDHKDGNPLNNSIENFTAYCKSCHARKGYDNDGLLGRPKQ